MVKKNSTGWVRVKVSRRKGGPTGSQNSHTVIEREK